MPTFLQIYCHLQVLHWKGCFPLPRQFVNTQIQIENGKLEQLVCYKINPSQIFLILIEHEVFTNFLNRIDAKFKITLPKIFQLTGYILTNSQLNISGCFRKTSVYWVILHNLTFNKFTRYLRLCSCDDICLICRRGSCKDSVLRILKVIILSWVIIIESKKIYMFL